MLIIAVWVLTGFSHNIRRSCFLFNALRHIWTTFHTSFFRNTDDLSRTGAMASSTGMMRTEKSYRICTDPGCSNPSFRTPLDGLIDRMRLSRLAEEEVERLLKDEDLLAIVLQRILEETGDFEIFDNAIRSCTRNDSRVGDPIDLRVAKAIPSDVGHGRIRLPLDNDLGLKPGDFVSVEGCTGPLASRGSTAAIVWRARPEDKDISVARMDGIIRRNAKLKPGDVARITKLEPEPCSELVLCPELKDQPDLSKIRYGKGIEGFVRRGLNKRPVKSGDAIYIPGLTLFAEALPFRVKGTSPGGFVIVNPGTKVRVIQSETEVGGGTTSDSGDTRQACCCKAECRLSGTDPDTEVLVRLLSGMSFTQRMMLLSIAGMISKSDGSDSNTTDRRTH